MRYGYPAGKGFHLAIVGLFAALALTACSGGNGSQFTSNSGATFPMGQAGGNITYQEQDNPNISVELDFPQGAVPDGTVISIQETNAYSSDPNVIDGLVFDFGPDGILFGAAVQLILTYDPAALGGASPSHLRIHKRSGSSWQELPTTVDTVAHTLTASLSGFSTYAGFRDIAPPVTTANPAGGTYATAQSVLLSCDDGTGSGCAGTYFTTDGSTPGAPYSPYTEPIVIAADTVLKFYSVDNAGNEEAVKTENYFLTTVPPTFTVGGTVTGLTGTVVLQNNGGDDLTRTTNSSFTFETHLPTSSPYLVTVPVWGQPNGQACTVANGSGTIADADVTDVVVTCADIPPSNTPPVNTTGANFINGGATSTTSLTFSLAISATDDAGVVAYLVQEGSSTPPSSGDPGWVAVTPATAYSATVSHTFSSNTAAGTKTVYVFFKDGDGAVSAGVGDFISYAPGGPVGVTIDFETLANGFPFGGSGPISTQWASLGVTFTFTDAIQGGGYGTPYNYYDPGARNHRMQNDVLQAGGGSLTGVIHILFSVTTTEVKFLIMFNPALDPFGIDPISTAGQPIPQSAIVRVDGTYGQLKTQDVTITYAGGIKEIRLLATSGTVFVDDLRF